MRSFRLVGFQQFGQWVLRSLAYWGFEMLFAEH